MVKGVIFNGCFLILNCNFWRSLPSFLPQYCLGCGIFFRKFACETKYMYLIMQSLTAFLLIVFGNEMVQSLLISPCLSLRQSTVNNLQPMSMRLSTSLSANGPKRFYGISKPQKQSSSSAAIPFAGLLPTDHQQVIHTYSYLLSLTPTPPTFLRYDHSPFSLARYQKSYWLGWW